MSKTFRRYEPDQMLLMPVALQEWLPADHLAYFISDVVDQVDLKEILSRYEGEERGYPPYHPVMMVKVLVYAYCVGAPSSRRIEKRLHEDIAFRVLAANNTPDFRTISDFRKEHLVALGGLFLTGIPQIKPTFLDIAPSGIPSNIIPHSKGVKCGLIRSNSPFSYSNHRPAKPKIPKPLVYAQVSPWEPLLRPRNRNQSRCS